jgi:hypothetical protein
MRVGRSAKRNAERCFGVRSLILEKAVEVEPFENSIRWRGRNVDHTPLGIVAAERKHSDERLPKAE